MLKNAFSLGYGLGNWWGVASLAFIEAYGGRRNLCFVGSQCAIAWFRTNILKGFMLLVFSSQFAQ